MRDGEKEEIEATRSTISNSLDCDVAIFAIERIGRYRAELGRECKEGEKGNKEFGSLLAHGTRREILKGTCISFRYLYLTTSFAIYVYN